jgi:hypothetical protein
MLQEQELFDSSGSQPFSSTACPSFVQPRAPTFWRFRMIRTPDRKIRTRYWTKGENRSKVATGREPNQKGAQRFPDDFDGIIAGRLSTT